MEKIGDYAYPTLGTFADALNLAEVTLKKYGGIIPNIDAAQALGYNVKDRAAISGTIYKRINDLEMFQLFVRERGGLKTTELAAQALNPYDSTQAAEGKVKALRNITLINRAFDAWNGEIPDETAFPAKLAEITGVSWLEAQKHVSVVRKLIIEAFQYLKSSAALPAPIVQEADRRELEISKPIVAQEAATVSTPYGEVRTTMGTIVVKDKRTWKIAKELLYALGEQLGVEEQERS